jgi:hypothetical protein
MDDPVVFFNDEEISSKKVILLAKCPERSLQWEGLSCSDFSPAIVGDLEVIARQVFSPIHFDAELNKLKPHALDDVFNKGLSTNRLKYIDKKLLNEVGENKALRDCLLQEERGKNPDRKYLGFVVAKVSDIRYLLEEQKSRVFAVYDTGLETQIDHADVCCLKTGPSLSLPKKAAKIHRRELLSSIFSDLIAS